MDNKQQKLRDVRVCVYGNTPFTITQEDVLLFNSLKEQDEYFNTQLEVIYETDNNSYVKDTNYLTVQGNKEKFNNATYLRFFVENKWIYAFIIDTVYLNTNTTAIIFEYDYFNTYQQHLNFSKIGGLVEQSHLKRKDHKHNFIFVNQAQGFDVGEKVVYKTISHTPDFIWLVIVTKPSYEIGNNLREFGTINGTYKGFHYYLLPVDRKISRVLSFVYKDTLVRGTNDIFELLKTLTSTFDDSWGEITTNTVNQIINIYTTKDVGINYEYEPNNDLIVIKNTSGVRIVNTSGETTDETLPDLDIDDENQSTNCPIYPVKDYILTSGYGWRSDPFTSERKWHNGTDFAPKVTGTKPDILAVQDAKVITKQTTSQSGGFGNYLELKHINGDNHISAYAHLDSFNVNVGDTVKQGQKIGVMGTTGNSTGVHLHFEIHKNVDKTIYGMNGTASDPLDYLDNCVPISPETFKGSLSNVSYLGGTEKTITLSEKQVNDLISACKKYKILPSGVLCQLWLESNWGNSEVAKLNNNWGGLTWVDGGNDLDPEVTKVGGRSKGSPRPANEGGNYIKYSSLEYYFKDYLFLLGKTGYNVVGKQTIGEYTKGLFKVGGATYDYAASGYSHYIGLMTSIDKSLSNRNPNYKDVNKGVF